MKTFSVEIRRYDRKEGTSNWTRTKIVATSMSTAISRGTREYLAGLDRKAKRDAAKQLEVRARALVELQDAPAEVYAEVDRLIGRSA